ncbi:MAG: BNR repeat-containing protein [Candidatus Hinthialibacter antarcticus]|nr:BNR repeat-containing protein [Candidatus Hinthialibacter antarcticus]
MKLKTLSLSLFALSLLCVLFAQGEDKVLRKVPVALGLAAHPVNGGDCLISDDEFQYIAFYDADHQMTVGKRKLSETEWEFAKLPETVGWDTHNKVVIFQDNDGYLHVTGNMHNHPLNYFQTKKPQDIQTFETIDRWTGFKEDRVCYPNLTQMSDGTILMMHRFGGSGNGMRILKQYDEKTQTWSGPEHPITNGMDRKPTCNAYPIGRMQEDNNGVLHFAWCWRETPDVLTNFDICYAKSLDKGLTWLSWNGKPFDLPITPENAEVVDPIPQKTGLMNGGSHILDDAGNPYIGYTRFDKNGCNQLFVATPDDEKWNIIQITDWQETIQFEGRGSIPKSPPTPSLRWKDGNLHIRYGYSLVKPSQGVMIVTREELLDSKPGSLTVQPPQTSSLNIPSVRAVNRGPLPEGQVHYMQQQVARANRDRKPESPKSPTMVYVVETFQD